MNYTQGCVGRPILPTEILDASGIVSSSLPRCRHLFALSSYLVEDSREVHNRIKKRYWSKIQQRGEFAKGKDTWEGTISTEPFFSQNDDATSERLCGRFFWTGFTDNGLFSPTYVGLIISLKNLVFAWHTST